MSIKSKDCVDAIIAKVPDTKAGDWKRRTKMTVGDEIFRIFEDKKTGAIVNVVEKNGSLDVDICDSPEPETSPLDELTVIPNGQVVTNPNSKYVYAIATGRTRYSDKNEDSMITITLRSDLGSDQFDDDIFNALRNIDGLDSFQDEWTSCIGTGKRNHVLTELGKIPFLSYDKEWQQNCYESGEIYGFMYDNP